MALHAGADSHAMDAADEAIVASPAPAPPRKVNRSCLECTRRKIKCDGQQPCSSCVYYRSPDACGYRQRSKRNAVSRSTFERVTDRVRSQSSILEALFPGISEDTLHGKSRHELLKLLPIPVTEREPQPEPQPPPIDAANDGQGSQYEGLDDSAPMSENGEPPAERRWDETLEQSAHNATDDINAIGLATDHQARSYLGMSSMSAVFRAIFRLCPAAKDHAAQASKALAAVPPQPQPPMPFWGRDSALDKLREQRCIDFYFEHVHSITPMIDEADFRAQYTSGTRQDSSWSGLLHMVFAMGSIASGSDNLHEYYYRQARSFITLDSLGAGNLDNLQALCLLGGYYLHYRNSPNMAYSVLGAAHRVAIALGLHRETRREPVFNTPEEANTHRRKMETRRRTWWGFFCLDTWASMTQGRPTCGRWDGATMDTYFPAVSSPVDYENIFLTACASFCLICDKVQHRLARFHRLTHQEVLGFDTELLRWYEGLPACIREPLKTPSRFQIAREFLRNRYLNARMLLTRSCFLYIASGSRKYMTHLGSESQQLREICCQVASETIDTIALYWTPNRVHVWSSAWYLFQACTTPLLSLAVDKNIQTASVESVAAWRASLVKALETFAEMRPWMRASDRSPDIVAALYEALTFDNDVPTTTPSATDGSLELFGWYDDQLGEMDWSTFLGGENFTIEGFFPT